MSQKAPNTPPTPQPVHVPGLGPAIIGPTVTLPGGGGQYLLDGRPVTVLDLAFYALDINPLIRRVSNRRGMDYEVDSAEAADVLRAAGHTVTPAIEYSDPLSPAQHPLAPAYNPNQNLASFQQEAAEWRAHFPGYCCCGVPHNKHGQACGWAHAEFLHMAGNVGGFSPRQKLQAALLTRTVTTAPARGHYSHPDSIAAHLLYPAARVDALQQLANSANLASQLEKLVERRLAEPGAPQLLRWDISACSICRSRYGYRFRACHLPSFDGACECASTGPQTRTWDDVAEAFRHAGDEKPWWLTLLGPDLLPAKAHQ